jgi:hypothetical protein
MIIIGLIFLMTSVVALIMPGFSFFEHVVVFALLQIVGLSWFIVYFLSEE